MRQDGEATYSQQVLSERKRHEIRTVKGDKRNLPFRSCRRTTPRSREISFRYAGLVNSGSVGIVAGSAR